MLNIVFLLLVFFIVTQTFEDDEPDLSINLPSAETPKPGDCLLYTSKEPDGG